MPEDEWKMQRAEDVHPDLTVDQTSEAELKYLFPSSFQARKPIEFALLDLRWNTSGPRYKARHMLPSTDKKGLELVGVGRTEEEAANSLERQLLDTLISLEAIDVSNCQTDAEYVDLSSDERLQLNYLRILIDLSPSQ